MLESSSLSGPFELQSFEVSWISFFANYNSTLQTSIWKFFFLVLLSECTANYFALLKSLDEITQMSGMHSQPFAYKLI